MYFKNEDRHVLYQNTAGVGNFVCEVMGPDGIAIEIGGGDKVRNTREGVQLDYERVFNVDNGEKAVGHHISTDVTTLKNGLHDPSLNTVNNPKVIVASHVFDSVFRMHKTITTDHIRALVRSSIDKVADDGCVIIVTATKDEYKGIAIQQGNLYAAWFWNAVNSAIIESISSVQNSVSQVFYLVPVVQSSLQNNTIVNCDLMKHVTKSRASVVVADSPKIETPRHTAMAQSGFQKMFVITKGNANLPFHTFNRVDGPAVASLALKEKTSINSARNRRKDLRSKKKKNRRR